MQTIDAEYKQAGHAMRFVKRLGMVGMFKAVGADYWEIHRIRVAQPREVFGRSYPEREVLASNEDFGTYGWACTTKERAEGRFEDAVACENAVSS